MVKIQILDRVDFENEKMPGTLIPFEQFKNLVSLGAFYPDDGTIEDIFVNDFRTNISIKGWNCANHLLNEPELNFETTIEGLSNLPLEFLIRWCNK